LWDELSLRDTEIRSQAPSTGETESDLPRKSCCALLLEEASDKELTFWAAYVSAQVQ